MTSLLHLLPLHKDVQEYIKKYYSHYDLQLIGNSVIFNIDFMNWTAKKGYLNIMKYAHENGCPWDYKTTFFAAKNGHLDCLKYAHENGCWVLTNSITYNALNNAVRNGHLDCLKYLHKNTRFLTSSTTYNAAYNGHLDCLKYLHENGCPWDYNTPYYAAKNGHLDCLRYVREHDKCDKLCKIVI